MTLVLGFAALLSFGCAAVVGGAWLLTALPLDPGPGAALAGTLGVVVGFLLPLLLVARFRGPKTRSHPARLTLGVLTGWNTLLAALPLGLAPGPTAAVVRVHGAWPLAGASSPPVDDALARLADALTPGTGTPPVPSPVPDAALTPRTLYAQAADAVVVVDVQMPGPTDVLQALLGLAGGKAPGADTLMSGHGSGFFVREDGWVVTNYHVVGTARRLTVRLKGGTRLSPVSVLATDPAHDLALLGVGGSGHPVLPLSDTPAEIGDHVYAIGSPLGLDHTLTEGVVGGRREVQGTHMIQAQATVAPGSSGGPLLDERGRVVGINTATQGADFTLAVDVHHLVALLAQPLPVPPPDPLPATEPDPRVVGLVLTGLAATPTELENTASALSLPLQGAASCFTGLPPDTGLVLVLPGWGPAAPRDTANLTGTAPETARDCLGPAVRMQAALLPLALRAAPAAGGPVLASWDLVGFDGPTEVKLGVQVRYGGP